MLSVPKLSLISPWITIHLNAPLIIPEFLCYSYSNTTEHLPWNSRFLISSRTSNYITIKAPLNCSHRWKFAYIKQLNIFNLILHCNSALDFSKDSLSPCKTENGFSITDEIIIKKTDKFD